MRGHEVATERELTPVNSLESQLLIGLCVAAIAIGWGLFMAGLLYVVSQYSATVWLLTAMGLALAHIALAAACWRCAMAVGKTQKADALDRGEHGGRPLS